MEKARLGCALAGRDSGPPDEFGSRYAERLGNGLDVAEALGDDAEQLWLRHLFVVVGQAIPISSHRMEAIRKLWILDESMFLGKIGDLAILETGKSLPYGKKMAGNLEKRFERSPERGVGCQMVSPV